MSLPKHIQQELEEAEAIERAMAEPAQPEETPTEVEALEPVAEPQESPPAPEEPAPEEPRWEERYRALQGKYDAEVPRLHQQNRELAQQLEEVQAKLDALLEAEDEPADEERPQYVSEKDEEEFGSELIDLQRRVAKEQNAELMKELAALREENARLAQELGQMKQTSTRTAEQVFFDKLNAAVPDWEQINQDPAWLQWLAEKDPMTGNPRQMFLDDAHRSLDVDRAANIFKMFKQATGKTVQPAQRELESQVSPPRTASAQPVQEPAGSKKIWTQAEIAQALDPRNLRKMSADEIAALDAEINAAVAEGRVSS